MCVMCGWSYYDYYLLKYIKSNREKIKTSFVVWSSEEERQRGKTNKQSLIEIVKCIDPMRGGQ